MIRSLFFTALLAFAASSAIAQDSLISPSTTTVGSVLFVSHTVVKGETIYGITKQYSISEEELFKFNPFLIDGLKIGQVLTIPVQEELDEEEENTDPVILHRVEPGNTIFNICQTYGISEMQLYDANMFLYDDGLQVGQLLRIPVFVDLFASAVDPDTVRDVESAALDSLYRNDVPKITIGVALPFYLEINDSLEIHRELEEEERIYGRSKAVLSFYTGVKCVLDSLSKLGGRFELKVIDTNGKEESKKDWCTEKNWYDLDLLIGPLFSENVDKLAVHLDSLGIELPVLVPFSTKPELFYRYPNLLQVTPSDRQMNLELTSAMIRNYTNETIHIVTTDSSLDLSFSELISNKLQLYVDTNLIVFHEKVGDKKLAIDFLESKGTKVVFLATYDEVFVTDFLRRVNGLRHTNIVVFGADWIPEMDVESVYLNNLNFHYPSPAYCDFSSPDLIPWIQKYRNEYHADLNMMALYGLDLSLYATELLGSYTDFEISAQAIEWEGFQIGMDVRKTSSGSLINKKVYILKYENFELVEIK